MSDKALAWAQDQKAPNVTAKFLLMRLAAYADVEGVAWAFVERLAAEIGTVDRTVQRALRALEKVGLIRHTGRFRRRNVPFYQLAMGAAEAAPGEASNGDNLSPLAGAPEGANGDTAVTPNGDTGVTLKQRKPSSEGSNDPPSERARAGERVGFEAAFAAYPEAGRKGVSSERLGGLAWANELAGGEDPGAMLDGCRAYAADRSLWGSSGKPKAFHNFISGGCWKGLAPAVAAAPVRRFPDAAVRLAFVAAFDEQRCSSWLDPAGWRAEERVVVARTGTAAKWLAENAGGFIQAMRLRVEGPGR